ncbi:transposase, partial [Alicyclobacillus cellulosilyticus]|uniref:transposase n=1 Tax=Alicyclobacillus cellulosilyticus TaxID=1003997 RepID=UPI001663D619
MRKHYSASFKAQVVLELLREEKTVAQLASEHGVHPTMLHRWKNTAVDNLSTLFEDVDKKSAAVAKKEYEKEIEELYSKIGRLTTQVEWLKKKNLASTRTREERLEMVERDNSEIPLSTQAELLSLNRTSLYYKPVDKRKRQIPPTLHSLHGSPKLMHDEQ